MASLLDPRNPLKIRRATRPAAGTARWLTRPNAEHAGGVLEINGTRYEVLPLYDGESRVGYRLLKADGTMYDVDTTREPWLCDCPDATYHPERPGGCKHVLALRAARSSSRCRRAGDRGRGAGLSSRRGVRRSAKRCNASRDVTQRPPSRSASSLMVPPSRARAPESTQRQRQAKLTGRPSLPGGSSLAASLSERMASVDRSITAPPTYGGAICGAGRRLTRINEDADSERLR
jgi:hypothetical protein